LPGGTHSRLARPARVAHAAAVSDTRASNADAGWTGPRMGEFVALMAALMAVNALAVDSMLPALPQMAEAVGAARDNHRQLVVTFFLLGMGGAQLFYGPLSDRFGRKPVLLLSLLGYVAFSLLVGLSQSFALLLAARLMQGVAAAGSRVVVVSVIRDRFEGALMARTMSMTSIVFMLVPILAPSLGQAVLAVGDWRMIFYLLALYGVIVLVWFVVRLPETLPRERRRPLSLAAIREATIETLSHPLSIGNTIALTLLVGALFAFINSIQQIVFDVFKQPQLMSLLFAVVAGTMALSSFANSRVVVRFGARRVMIVGLAGFVAASFVHLAFSLLFGETLVQFIIFQSLMMANFGLISANLGSIAMQPLGHVAGTAASVQGVITTLGGALIGLVIGQMFNGTTLPLIGGFALCGLAALLIVLRVNR
jgi:DHA1 family bicyclomycin/chloramphenicol resistance-like MFS transporter